MAEPTTKSPLMYDVKTPDFSKLNLAGVGESEPITGAYEEALKQRKALADSLEARYAQPNLFKIAAGFLKPQLGGFGASLGSASEAMGENVEQQRAIQPTIAQMRAEIAAQEVPLNQQYEQQREFKEYIKNKEHDTQKLAKIKNLAPDSSVAKAIDSQIQAESTIAGTKSTQTGTQVTGQKAVAENPFIVLSDPMFKGTVAEPKPDQVAGYIAKLDAARPKDIDPAQWAGMSVSAKQEEVARYAAKQTESGMDEEGKSAFVARNADNLLNDLTYLRALAVDPRLAPMFSLFKNGDAIGMLRSFLDKNPGNAQAAVEGLTAAAMESLKNADADTRAKADRFIKGIAKLEVNLRGSNVNPTDALQQLNSMQSPNLANSQSGFVGILDQMGLQAKHDLDRHDLRIESKVPARRMLTSPEARALENRYRDEAADLARSDALNAKPSWYTPPASAAATRSSAARSTVPVDSSAAMPATGPTGGNMTERLRAEKAAREAKRPPQ